MPEAKKLEDAAKAAEEKSEAVDARPPSLGAGDDADPDRDRARRDHDPDAQSRRCNTCLRVRRVSIALGALALAHLLHARRPA